MAEVDRKRFVGRALWVVNLLSFVGLCAWIAWDGQFAEAASRLPARLYQAFDNWSFAGSLVPAQHTARKLGLLFVAVLAVVSAIGIFAGLFLGSRSHRRVRSWFFFTILVSALLTFGVTWRDMAWHAQKLRMQSRLGGLESVAASLLVDWPTADREHPDLGQFMAYPQGDPSMLLLLTTPKIGRAEVAISGIEKSASGGLRFQLAGSESGAWLEWHPRETKPESFRGGLQTRYQLERSAPLADGWFLVRYRESF
jgi:hypothetical protein